VDFIADLRQAEDLARIPVGRDVVVIGGGMTAIDAAVQAKLLGAPEGLEIAGGKIAVTGAGRTGAEGIWAGGDCASGGDDLTVTAVAEGRDAAEDIHATLMA